MWPKFKNQRQRNGLNLFGYGKDKKNLDQPKSHFPSLDQNAAAKIQVDLVRSGQVW